MTPKQYADDIIAKVLIVADLYGESTLNEVLVKGVDPSVRDSLCRY